jgi:dynein intermediate chain, cytosolic
MSDAEIAAKKKKLEELKAKKLAREQQQLLAPTPASPTAGTPQSSSFLEQHQDNTIKDVNALLAAVAKSPSKTVSSAAPVARKKKFTGNLAVVNTEPLALVYEEKSVAHMAAQTDESDRGKWQTAKNTASKDGEGDEEEAIEERMRSRETELQKRVDQFLIEQQEFAIQKADARRAENQEKLKHRRLTQAEREEIISSSGFRAFFDRASKLIERQLNSPDTALDSLLSGSFAPSQESKSSEAPLLKKCVLQDPSRNGRAVTCLDWSPKYSELLLCALAGKDDPLSPEPDGIVLLWNLHMPSRPEYTFTCNSAVLAVAFHPTNSSLIFGGTASGAVVMWDIRERQSLPVMRTPLTKGHVYPVYSLSLLAKSTKQHDVVSLSTDGYMCVWEDNNLSEPKGEVLLRNGPLYASGKKPSVSTSCCSIPTRGDPGSLMVGSDDGSIYKACFRSDRADKLGIEAASENATQHQAPLTTLTFQPNFKQMSSELFLTSSLDWTIKLWNYASNEASKFNPMFTFDKCTDTVLDVQWAPAHPGVFASGDSAGKLLLWNLCGDFDTPCASISLEEKNMIGEAAAVSRIKWGRAPWENSSEESTAEATQEKQDHNSGHQQLLAVGTSMGSVIVYGVADELGRGSPTSCNLVADALRRMAVVSAGAAAASQQ